MDQKNNNKSDVNVIQLQDLTQEKVLKDFLEGKGYVIHKKIGQGRITEVFSATQISSKQIVAVKKLIDAKNLNNLEVFSQERDILKKIRNQKYALQIIDDFQNLDLGLAIIIVEFCDCDLANILNDNEFTFGQLLAFTFQILNGLLVFQLNGIVHGDIKREHILFIKKEQTFKIADFGIKYQGIQQNDKITLNNALKSDQIKIEDISYIIQQNQQYGESICYQSPEFLFNQMPITVKADVYSIGQMLVEIFLKKRLKQNEWLSLKSINIFEIIAELRESLRNKFVIEILGCMANCDQDQRLESQELLNNLKQFEINENCFQNLILRIKVIENIIQDNLKVQIDDSSANPDLQQPNINKNFTLDLHLKGKHFTATKNINKQSDLSQYQQVELTYSSYFSKSCCFFTKFGVQNVVQAIQLISQKENIISLYLYLGWNKINDEGIKKIAKSLEQLQNIKILSLDFYSNNISEGGTKQVVQSIQTLQNLICLYINLKSNYVPKSFEKYVEDKLSKIKSIKVEII